MRSLFVKRGDKLIAEIREIGNGEIETEFLTTLTPHFTQGCVVPGLSHFFTNLLPEGEIERSLISSQFGFPYADISYLSGLQQLEYFRENAKGLSNNIHLADSEPEILSLDENFTLQTIKHCYGKASLMRVAGVQAKLCVQYLDGDHYILKHAAPEVLKAEYYGMELSERAGIDTAAHSLVTLSDGELVYLCQRFDLGEPRLIIDGCQLLNIAPCHKYLDQCRGYIEHPSYESFGEELLNYAKDPGPLIEEYFRRIVFAYLIGNDDLHLKNFSFYVENGLVTGFTPQYDSVMLQAINPTGLKFMALDLMNAEERGEFSSSYDLYGFYTRTDFIGLGNSLGVDRSVNVIDEMLELISLLMTELALQGRLLTLFERNLKALRP